MTQGLHRVLFLDRIARRIEVIADVEADRSDRRLIAYPHAYGLRVVAEIARHQAVLRRARCDRGLMDSQHPTDDMVCRVEHVTHIVEEHKSQVIAHVRQPYWRSANFQVVDE